MHGGKGFCGNLSRPGLLMDNGKPNSHPNQRMMQITRNLALLLLLTLCTLAPLGCNADTQVLGWSHETFDPGRAKPHLLNVDCQQLECWVARSPAASKCEPKGYVLFFVGQADQVDRAIEEVADSWDKPVEIWGMNYPGSGGSQGPARVARVGRDALATYDAIKQIAGNRPIFVQGVSLGTTAALCVAANRAVDGVILFNPPPLRQLIIGEYSWWNLGLISHYIAGQIPADLDSIANASRATAPAVLLSAGADQTVPPNYQRMILDAYAGPKQIIEMPGRDHDDELTPQAVEKLTAGKDWLWQSAGASSTAATGNK
jgi:pimeloyl-ACP methyl ester carboxylesterase